MKPWKELAIGLALSALAGMGTAWATVEANKTSIDHLRADVVYIRERIDALYDRLGR